MIRLSNMLLRLIIISMSIGVYFPSVYAEDSQYKGSEAFNQFLSLGETVNQDTGSLNLNPTLVNLTGINKDISLTVKLVYSAGSTGNFGLPTGWSFDIPFIVPLKSLSLHGKNYAIDSTWKSYFDNFKSGLRYSNDRGLRLKEEKPSLKLPGKVFGTYKYLLVNGDGAHYYFDNVGKLRVLADGHDNQIAFYYDNDQKSVVGNHLKKIVDSYGQEVTFGYGLGYIEIGLPDGSKTTLRYNASGVKQLIDPLNNLTTFGYTNKNSTSVVNVIKYPTGLKTVINYGSGATYKSCGDSKTYELPQIHALTHSYKGNFRDKTVYNFSLAGGANYTGYPDYCLGGNTDTLEDSNNVHYFYTTRVEQLDESGKVLTQTDTTYNFMHLPRTTKSYLINDSGNLEYKRVDSDYNMANAAAANKHKRSPADSQPIAITTAWVVAQGNEFKVTPLTKTIQSFDTRYGKKISSELFECGKSGKNEHSNNYLRHCQLIGQANNDLEGHEIPYTDWSRIRSQTTKYQLAKKFPLSTDGDFLQGEAPQTVKTVDEVGQQAMVKTYTLAPDHLSVGSLVSTYGPSSEPNKPWKEIDTSYDKVGRVTQETLKWSKGAAPEYETVNESKTEHRYTYPAIGPDSPLPDKHLLSTVTTDPMGNQFTAISKVSLPGAPVVQITSPSGTVTKHYFDVLGRLIKDVIPGSVKGTTRTVKKVYSLAGNSGAGENSVTAITPLGSPNAAYGYQRKTVYDGQGHEIAAFDNEQADKSEKCKNGDDSCHPLSTVVTSSPARLLGNKTYTSLGKLASSSNIEGLTTTSTYDSFGRTTSSTDPLGNKSTLNYSDQDLIVTKFLNDTKVSMVELNPIGRKISETVFPNPDAKDATIDGLPVKDFYNYNMYTDIAYDGFGRATMKRVYKVPVDGSKIEELKALQQRFDPEGKVKQSEFYGRDTILNKDGTIKHVYNIPDGIRYIRNQSYNLLGKPITYTKEIRYPEGVS